MTERTAFFGAGLRVARFFALPPMYVSSASTTVLAPPKPPSHTVNHSANEYARLAGFIGINASENFFSIVKRGITGVYHSVSEAHLHRYLAEFDFRYNNRSGLGCEDTERARRAVAGIAGRRLTYNQPCQPAA